MAEGVTRVSGFEISPPLGCKFSLKSPDWVRSSNAVYYTEFGWIRYNMDRARESKTKRWIYNYRTVRVTHIESIEPRFFEMIFESFYHMHLHSCSPSLAKFTISTIASLPGQTPRAQQMRYYHAYPKHPSSPIFTFFPVLHSPPATAGPATTSSPTGSLLPTSWSLVPTTRISTLLIGAPKRL
jgi:hypothetical protein